MNKASAEICFVVPAFDSLRHAPLGVSTLIASCRARGLQVGAVYASLLLGARIGFDLYDRISGMLPTKQPGEYVFKPFAYPPEVLATIPDGPPAKVRDIVAAAAPSIADHLEEIAAAVAARNPRIVAITNTFQQNLPGFAIARRLRAAVPEALIVMGGANVAGVMAHGLAQVFDCVDYFFDGEGDIVFPDFCEDYLRRGIRPQGRVVACPPIGDMAAVPAADFSDFLAALRPLQAAGRLPPELPHFATYESSRGCWWGAKHHCTFCGLNARGMGFREKAPGRVVEEIRDLAAQWPDRVIRTADNIMPTSFFEQVLPRLESFEHRPQLFYEVKANLKEAQIAAMRRAGIYSIQPGIESLSSPVLKLMRKGVSAHQNITLLRLCTAYNMRVGWNLIYGFPGETSENYRDMLALLPALTHLVPPDGFSPIMIDRFSPYFDDPGSFGIASLRPFEAYLGLFPPQAPVDDIAYHFWGTYTTEFLDDTALREAFSAGVGHWRSLWSGNGPRPRLEALRQGGKLIVIDTRGFAQEPMTILPATAEDALGYFERPRRPDEVSPAAAAHVEEFLARRWVVAHEGLLLSLVARRADMAGAAVPAKAA
ncbi:MAG TPA: RiPP maturation radical SAM C-methyltransferase [Rhizomicrobium sp.]